VLNLHACVASSRIRVEKTRKMARLQCCAGMYTLGCIKIGDKEKKFRKKIKVTNDIFVIFAVNII
jgi:hypothetical protein